MPTAHEELFQKRKEVIEANHDLKWCDYELSHRILGRRKLHKKLADLWDDYEGLCKEYNQMFFSVLEKNHGIPKANVVKDKGSIAKKRQKLKVLVGKTVHKMTAVSMGGRIVFFVGDVALGENETVESSINQTTEKVTEA